MNDERCIQICEIGALLCLLWLKLSLQSDTDKAAAEFYLLERKLLKGMVTSLLGLQRLNEKIQLNL